MMPGSSRLQHREHTTQVTKDGYALQLEGGLTIHETGFGVGFEFASAFFPGALVCICSCIER